jgi:hypothetical protein
MDEDPPELPTKLKLKVTAFMNSLRQNPTKLQLKAR